MRDRRARYSKSGWEVRREWLRLEDAVPPAGDMNVRTLGDAIPALMKQFGLEANLWVNRLEEDWPALMGAVVAAHTRPGGLSDNRLTVFVDSSAWLYELSQSGHREMLANLCKKYGAGKIKEIRFQLDPGS